METDGSCLPAHRPLAKGDEDDRRRVGNRNRSPVLGRNGCGLRLERCRPVELAPVPRGRKPRSRHLRPAALGLGTGDQCGLARRSSRARVVFAHRVGETGVPHHGGERGRTGGSEEGPVFRRRPPGTPEATPALDGLVPRPRLRQDPLEHRASRSDSIHAHPPQEQLRLRDSGHRRQACVRAVRIRGPVLPRSPGQGGLVAADATPQDALWLGHLRLASLAPRSGVCGERQRRGFDLECLRRQDGQNPVASPAR